MVVLKRLKSVGIALCLVVFWSVMAEKPPSVASAEERSSVGTNANAADLESIVVTAPGAGQRIQDVQATVQVLDAKQIESFSGRSLAQIIQQAAGLFVTDAGSTSSVSLRGFAPGQTLILVDGMRRTGKYGETDLNTIPLEEIERIEIVRGPMSALYGADAMAGVVNIVRKKPSAKPTFSTTVAAGAAENGGRETTIARLGADLGAMGPTLHRFSMEIKDRGDFKEDKGQPYSNLKDENRYFLSYDGVFNFGDQHYFFWSAQYGKQNDTGRGSTAALNYPYEFEREEATYLYGRYHNEFGYSVVDWTAGMGRTHGEADRSSGPEETIHDQYETNLYVTVDYREGHTIILGTGVRREEIDLSILSDSPHRTVWSALGQYAWEILPRITVMGGVRYDDYSDFGNTTNPKISVVWHPAPFKLRGAFGTAYQAPSFVEQYGYFERSSRGSKSIVRGNPDLDPEESKTFEVAAEYSQDLFGVECVYHQSKISNLINSVLKTKTGNVAEYRYENVDEADISGLEFTGFVRLHNNLSALGSWAYLEKNDGKTGSRLTGYARNSAKASLVFDKEWFSFYTNYRHYFDYYALDWTKPRGSAPVDRDMGIVDVKVAFRFLNHHAFSVGVDNLFNEKTPSNYIRGAAPNDPGERYYYIQYALRW